MIFESRVIVDSRDLSRRWESHGRAVEMKVNKGSLCGNEAMATKNRLKKNRRVGSEGTDALRSMTCIQDRSEITDCVDCLNVLSVVWVTEGREGEDLSNKKIFTLDRVEFELPVLFQGALDTYRLLAVDYQLSNNGVMPSSMSLPYMEVAPSSCGYS